MGARYFYLEVTRPHRGEYRAELIELKVEHDAKTVRTCESSSQLIESVARKTDSSSQPIESSPYPITDAYARALEASIEANPHLWLWTHNRWKRTKREWDERNKKNTAH